MELLHRISDSFGFIGMGFVSLFTTLNPIGASAFFLSHPETLESEIFRKRIAKKSSIATFIILCLFAVLGKKVFKMMGITIDSFRIAGGIFIFTNALDMLRGANVRTKTLPEERAEAAQKDDFSIMPLAIPLLAGPGTITISILAMDKAVGLFQSVSVIVNLILVCLLTYFILVHSVYLLKFTGESGIRVLNRIMGLFVASIAVQMFFSGLKALL